MWDDMREVREEVKVSSEEARQAGENYVKSLKVGDLHTGILNAAREYGDKIDSVNWTESSARQEFMKGAWETLRGTQIEVDMQTGTIVAIHVPVASAASVGGGGEK